jgi:LysM repeat protein
LKSQLSVKYFNATGSLFLQKGQCDMRIIIGIIFIGIPFTLAAQSGRKITREEYIEIYKDLAMKEMEHYRIPASITLAQGLLESGNGNSTLARKANNHFGIKCHDWDGKTVRHDDDERNECFRKYKSVDESYRDHSEFLSTRDRYKSLFELEIDDYKAWAKGLKSVGYATSPTYSEALIKLIEKNELYKYDQEVIARSGGGKGKPEYDKTEYAGGRKVYYNNRVKYVFAREGDDILSLSEELDVFNWQLPKYNDLPDKNVFAEGEKVYLQPKRNKAEAGNKFHIVTHGESLHSISQLYAMKLEKLAFRNNLNPNAELTPGQELLLRGKVQGAKKELTAPKIEIKEEEPTEEFQIDFDVDG